jgi:hypothetical protein
MSNFSIDMVWTQFDRVEVEGRAVAVCKHCHRQLTGNRGSMCMHLRMKHNKPSAEASSQIEPPSKKLLTDTPDSKPTSDKPTSKPISDKPTTKPLPDMLQVHGEDDCNMGTPLPEKQAKDAVRYLALCANTPTAFRHAIDVLPKSSIRRVYDMVCKGVKVDAQVKLSPKQRRFCTKYVADSRASSKTKRRLLRSANKQAIRSVFGPLMLQVAFGAYASGVVSTTV